MTSVNREDRRCEEDPDYDWGACLDHMFYLRKGCQDPWNFNFKVNLPSCSNLTYLLKTYGQGPALENASSEERAKNWDGMVIDRPFMSERKLASIVRDGMNCKPPCRNINFDVSLMYDERSR